MFNIFQSAYTQFHSTESAPLVIHDHLTKAMDRQQDWSYSTRAIGCLRHNRRLHPTPSPHLLVWYRRQCSHLVSVILYISCRSFSVSCLDNLSSSLPLYCGVPQCSVLGPILFIMYTTPLSSLISQTYACHKFQVNHHLYADGT
jgi:hypothetical protein